jgi:hypothetical protein
VVFIVVGTLPIEYASTSFLDPMNDDQLHRLLRDSPSQISLPASFARGVWSRIEAEEANSPGAALSRAWTALLGAVARPAPAFALVAVCMFVGGILGWMTHDAEFRARGEVAYVESINPFLRINPEGGR